MGCPIQKEIDSLVVYKQTLKTDELKEMVNRRIIELNRELYTGVKKPRWNNDNILKKAL